MDKRKAANLEVKRRIKDALYDLMAEKSFSEITVTDIIQRAGVARAPITATIIRSRRFWKPPCAA